MAAKKDNGGMSPMPLKEPDNDSFAGRLAARLRSLRERCKLTAEEATEAISKAGYKISVPTLYRWEQGGTSPHIESFPAIAQAYKLKNVREVFPSEPTVKR